MTYPEVKKKVQAKLLEEVKSDQPRQWYYISMVREKFEGGVFLLAHGPTDAWLLLHRLGLYVEGCETSTMGPIDENMKKVPEDLRWRRLSREEVESIK